MIQAQSGAHDRRKETREDNESEVYVYNINDLNYNIE
jgi:hypothetical protein